MRVVGKCTVNRISEDRDQLDVRVEGPGARRSVWMKQVVGRRVEDAEPQTVIRHHLAAQRAPREVREIPRIAIAVRVVEVVHLLDGGAHDARVPDEVRMEGCGSAALRADDQHVRGETGRRSRAAVALHRAQDHRLADPSHSRRIECVHVFSILRRSRRKRKSIRRVPFSRLGLRNRAEPDAR